MTGKPPTVYVISSFGTKFVGMLLSCVHSVRRAAPEARVALFWNEIPEDVVRDLATVYGVETYRFGESLAETRAAVRAASKINWWAEAARRLDGPANLVFLDVDTLLVRDVSSYFEREFDLVFTVKDLEVYPINAGVMLAKFRPGRTEALRAFFREWEESTARIIADPELLAIAGDRARGYGAADQMAFSRMLGYERGTHAYSVTVGAETVRAVALPCAELNEVNSKPIEPQTHVIHYKSVWQDILLHGFNFSARRPKEASREMYVYYLKTYREAKARVAGTALSRRAKIFVPRYFGADWQVRPWLEKLHELAGPLRRFAWRAVWKIRKTWRRYRIA